MSTAAGVAASDAQPFTDMVSGFPAPIPELALASEGTGRLMRHVKTRSLADLERPALRDLVRVARTHRVPPLKD